MMTQTIQVTGMSCAHCVRAVSEEIAQLPGVTAVTVELHPEGASIVAIEADAEVGDEALATALDDAGSYRLVERS